MTLSFKHLATAYNGATEIAGSGLRVYTVLCQYEMGESAEYIAEAYDVPLAAVYEALAYAADHQDEMDAIRQSDRAAERQVVAQLPVALREEAEQVLRDHDQVRQEAIRRAKEARLGTPVP